MQLLQRWERALLDVVPEPSEQDDAPLVIASQRGNQEAFALLVRKYQRRIFHLSLGMLRDEHYASESTQEAFVAAWQRLPGIQDKARFSTWLYCIAYQCCLRQLGRHKQEHTLQSEGQAEQALGSIRPEKQCAETTQSQAMQTLGHKQLEQLPLTYRTVLILRHLHNKTYEEIATIISIPLGTVKTRLFRARTHLKERLAGTAPLVTREKMVGTPLTENEEVMHISEPSPFQGRGQHSIPDRQETDGFSQYQQAWLEKQQGWVEQQRSALTQQEAWLEQQHTVLVQQYSELVQQHQWVQQRRHWLDQQLHQLIQQESALTREDESGDRLSG